MERPRMAGGSSRLVSSLAVLGLILASVFMVVLVSSSSLVNPLNPLNGGGPNNNPGPVGTLVVRLQTNANVTNVLGAPTSQFSPLGEKAFTVTQDTNSSSPAKEALVTDTGGGAQAQLAPGRYLVNLQDQTLHIQSLVTISAGNETELRIQIQGSGFPLIYSEESGVFPTASGAQSTMYVEVRSPTAVATTGQVVLLKVRAGTPETGYLVNATVQGAQSPTTNTQWLQLGTFDTVNPVNASSILLTTWTFTSEINVFRLSLVGPAND
ncbi:MAG: hypothetical protein OK455_05685 [Thaumarchaeota archaeon]|nr:hypothetical protein [Nitrososphaerota archaeon]